MGKKRHKSYTTTGNGRHLYFQRRPYTHAERVFVDKSLRVKNEYLVNLVNNPEKTKKIVL